MSASSYKTKLDCSYCRLCANLFPETWLLDILNPQSLLESQILGCLQLRISSEDSNPKQICPPCAKSVADYYEFCQQVKKSQTAFGSTAYEVHPITKVEIDETADQDDQFYGGENDNFSDNSAGEDSGDDYQPGNDNDDSDDADEEWDVKLSDLKPNGANHEIKKENSVIIPPALLAEIYEDTPQDLTEMRKAFESKLDIFNRKKDNSSFITDERYARIIRELEHNAALPTVPAVEQRRLSKYELYIDDDNLKRLVTTQANGPQLIYVPKSELFDKIGAAHVESGHGGRQKTEDIIKAKYKNITRELIMMYLNLCKTCGRRRNQMKENARVRAEENGTRKEGPRMEGRETILNYQWKCIECNEILPTANDLRDHYDAAHQKPVEYICNECSKIYNSYISFRNHILRHRNRFKYKCEICSNFFSSNKKLQDHKERHNESRKKYYCAECGKSFLNESYLSVHKKRKHSDHKPTEILKTHACDECDKKFATVSSLNNHKKAHSGVREHTCEHCGKSFIYKKYLDDHMASHSSERPYKCDKCNASFKAKMYLRRHQFLHSGIKPYQCDVCGKKFPRKPALIEHSITHTDLYPFKCDICDKGFRSKKNVVWHQRLHTGEKPYSCEPCNRHFTCTSNYDKHMKRHHGVVKIKKEVAILANVPVLANIDFKMDSSQ